MSLYVELSYLHGDDFAEFLRSYIRPPLVGVSVMHERFVTLILGFQVQSVDDEFAQLAFGCLCVRSIGRGLARHVFCFFFLLFLNEDLDHLLDAIVCLASATPRS